MGRHCNSYVPFKVWQHNWWLQCKDGSNASSNIHRKIASKLMPELHKSPIKESLLALLNIAATATHHMLTPKYRLHCFKVLEQQNVPIPTWYNKEQQRKKQKQLSSRQSDGKQTSPVRKEAVKMSNEENNDQKVT